MEEMKNWVDEQYEQGRVTVMTDDELDAKLRELVSALQVDLKI